MVHKRYTVVFLCIMVTCFQRVTCTIGFSQMELSILVHNSDTVEFSPTDIDFHRYPKVTIHFEIENKDVVDVKPESRTVHTPDAVTVLLKAEAPGKSNVAARIVSGSLNVTGGFVIVNVHKSDIIVIVSNIIGWIYFLAWSVSFYPQIWSNFQRKSVVGLNFDFVSLNIVGFAAYSIFNFGLFSVPVIREQYSKQYPTSVIPVLVQDIVFAAHGTLMTAITGLQCLIYERRTQRISVIGKGFHVIFASVFFISVILVNLDHMNWLDFIYTCSYIKLCVTITKYVPQAWMNYARKSTGGWNIYNVLLDLTGGILSILQMFLNAYNYEEWESLWENPTKFWLGVLTIIFDAIFIIQHYVLYREEIYAGPESQDMLDEEKYLVSKTSISTTSHLTHYS